MTSSNTNNYMLNFEGKEIDRTDERWLHPLIRDARAISDGASPIRDWFDPKVPIEQRAETVRASTEPFRDFFLAQLDSDEVRAQGSFENYETEHGCPEEPDAPAVRLYVRNPTDDGAGLRPCVFVCGGGALAFSLPEMWSTKIYELSRWAGAVVVTPRYRPALEARYPAAINDLHAAYEWVHEHADELRVDTDRICLYGNSSGGHLALCLAFRLKRFGYAPRGCVVETPVTDNRFSKPSSRYFMTDGDWDGPAVSLSALQYLGPENAANPLLGPEAFANRATVDDCRGLCPVSIATYEMDPDSDYNAEFAAKLKEAGVFVDHHLWAGSTHSAHGGIDEGSVAYTRRRERVTYETVCDFLENDCRRPWTL